MGVPLKKTSEFNPDCRSCPRLAAYLDEVKQGYPDYHARPVASFGDPEATLLIVGLAPGMHGANATGRPFTGDFAGILLYETLYKFGLSNQPTSTSQDDGLRLVDCRITNAVKCLPPQNKPTTAEVKACNDYLTAELNNLPRGAVVLALGAIAHGAVLRALALRAAQYPFQHCRAHHLPQELYLVDSYHCSRYNTQTRRLTETMFHQVFELAKSLLNGAAVC